MEINRKTIESTGTSLPSGCPAHKAGNGENLPVTETWSIWDFLVPNNAKSPVATNSTSLPVKKDGDGVVRPIASIEEAERYAQIPQPDQRIFLDTTRQVSSISRGATHASDSTVPSHQPHVGLTGGNADDTNHHNWVYPSEQQMYNAMRKKGWSNIPEDSIPTVLQIHNNINERTWRQIQDWEGTDSLNLVSFQGRPREVSPKAFFWCYLLRLYDPPFDRHDWYVMRETPSNTIPSSSLSSSTMERARQPPMTTSPQRYIIDYYYLPPEHPSQPPVPYVDARPALDHPRAVWLHSRRFLQFAFPGITAYLQRQGQK